MNSAFAGHDPSDRWRDRLDPRIVRLVRPLARAMVRAHGSRLDGTEHLPKGGALLVGNHGLLGYEAMCFFEHLYGSTGRHPLGLADHWFFRVPLLRDALVRVGGMYGSAKNAIRALSRGDWVVCYPGGAREVLKRDARDRYRLRWEKSKGFVRVALACGVPIVPFAAAGVDDTFDIVTTIEGSGELLMGHPKYDLPLLWGGKGRGPLPRPVPFWFRLGAPITPDAAGADAKDDAAVDVLHRTVWNRAQRLLDDLVGEYRVTYPKEPSV